MPLFFVTRPDGSDSHIVDAPDAAAAKFATPLSVALEGGIWITPALVSPAPIVRSDDPRLTVISETHPLIDAAITQLPGIPVLPGSEFGSVREKGGGGVQTTDESVGADITTFFDPDSDEALFSSFWESIFNEPPPPGLKDFLGPDGITSLLSEGLAQKGETERAFTNAETIEQIIARLGIQLTFEQQKILEEIRVAEDPAVKERLVLELANDLAISVNQFGTLEDKIALAQVVNSGPVSVATINADGQLAVVSTQGLTQVEIETMRSETDTAITLLETEARKDIARTQFGDPESRALIARGGLSPEQVLLQTAIESSAGLRDFEAQIRGNPAILGALTASGGVGAAGALIEKFNPFNIFKQAQDQGVFGLGGVPQGGQAGSGVFLNASGEQVRLGPGGNLIEIGGSVPTIPGLPKVGGGAMPTFPEFENPGLDIRNPILAGMLPREIRNINEGGASTSLVAPSRQNTITASRGFDDLLRLIGDINEGGASPSPLRQTTLFDPGRRLNI